MVAEVPIVDDSLPAWRYTGIECDSCKELAFCYDREKCKNCGSGMTLWGDNSND